MEKLPSGVFCLALSNSLDDRDVIENYLSDPEFAVAAQKCLPLALREVLSPYAEHTGLPPMPIPNARDTFYMLATLWTIDEPSRLGAAAVSSIPYLIPYLLAQKPSQAIIDRALKFAIIADGKEAAGLLLGAGANARQHRILQHVNDPAIAKLLLTAGAGARPSDLMQAAENGNTDMVEFFTTVGGTSIHADNDRIFHFAVKSGNPKLIQYLADHAIIGTPNRAFVAAAAGGNIDLMDKYVHPLPVIREGAPIIREGVPAILEGAPAILGGAPGTIGVDINTNNGQVMVNVIANHQYEAMQYLIGNGFDVTHPRYLDNAALTGDITSIKMLMNAGARTAGPDNDYRAVVRAVAAGYPDVVQYFFDIGVHINEVAFRALRALARQLRHRAGQDNPDKWRNYTDVLAVLLRAGVGIVAPDDLKALVNREDDADPLLPENSLSLVDLAERSRHDPHFSEYVDDVVRKAADRNRERLNKIQQKNAQYQKYWT